MGLKSKACRLLAAAAGACALFGATPAFAQEFAPAPLSVRPLMAPTPRSVEPVPEPKIADTHVESTELGFERGIGPAVGRTVTYHKKRYEVTDVAAIGGGPTFSGGSRFTVAPEGRALSIGLKKVDPEKLAELASPGASTSLD